MTNARKDVPGKEAQDRIDVNQDDDLREWARKLDATREQLKEAVQAVGDRASDVEEHLKGSRSTTNAERTHKALGGSDKPR